MIKTPVINIVHYNFNQNENLTIILTGGLWTGEIPELNEDELPVTMPYGKIELESARNEYILSSSYIEHSKVNLLIYSTSRDELNNIIATFEKEWNYRDTDFDIPDDVDTSFMHLMQLEKSLMTEFIRDKEGNQVYSGSLSYEITLFRQ